MVDILSPELRQAAADPAYNDIFSNKSEDPHKTAVEQLKVKKINTKTSQVRSNYKKEDRGLPTEPGSQTFDSELTKSLSNMPDHILTDTRAIFYGKDEPRKKK